MNWSDGLWRNRRSARAEEAAERTIGIGLCQRDDDQRNEQKNPLEHESPLESGISMPLGSIYREAVGTFLDNSCIQLRGTLVKTHHPSGRVIGF